DDGKGIDGDKVVEKVLEKKLLEPEIVRNLSERDKFGLIFLPGLSTADSVTNISGRGVGMDVVKSNIDRINGLIDIQSELGRGTHIKLKIPLTLAIIPALMVNCDNERYAIPQMSLISVVSGDTAREGIEVLHHVPVYRWRGKLLPLVYLRDELKLGQSVGENDPISIIILQAENREFGLIVDEVNDTEEIVVKPLGKYLRSIPIYAGATILGDGMAALILDVLGLAQSAAVVSELGGSEYGVIEEEVQEVDFDKQMVLLVRHNGSGMAIPVSRVPRLEKIAYKSIEYSGETPVVQYRGSILRLKMLQGGALEASESKSESMLNVVVCSEEGGLVGVVVDEIVDIVEEHFTIQPNGIRKNGILGTAVIHEKVVEVVDVDMLSSGLY
ncbi:MAG: two-component system chemotaxis sensor kinase CheA, partial [Candidatus Latescibacterota bacterium]